MKRRKEGVVRVAPDAVEPIEGATAHVRSSLMLGVLNQFTPSSTDEAINMAQNLYDWCVPLPPARAKALITNSHKKEQLALPAPDGVKKKGGGQWTPERRARYSATMKELYRTGKLTHWTKMAKHKKEQK